MAGLGEALQELQSAHGLDLAAVVTADGLVVEAASIPDIDAESLCSVAANGLLMMDALGQELGDDQADVTTIEYREHIVVIAPLDADNLLVLLAGGGMNLGRLRIVLRRHLDQLTELVGQL
jgi:uncharacterized protein